MRTVHSSSRLLGGCICPDTPQDRSPSTSPSLGLGLDTLRGQTDTCKIITFSTSLKTVMIRKHMLPSLTHRLQYDHIIENRGKVKINYYQLLTSGLNNFSLLLSTTREGNVSTRVCSQAALWCYFLSSTRGQSIHKGVSIQSRIFIQKGLYVDGGQSSRGDHSRDHYASYCNAFLFLLIINQIECEA